MRNPQYPIQVEGWRGAVSKDELDSLAPQKDIEALIESAYVDHPAYASRDPRWPLSQHLEELT